MKDKKISRLHMDTVYDKPAMDQMLDNQSFNKASDDDIYIPQTRTLYDLLLSGGERLDAIRHWDALIKYLIDYFENAPGGLDTIDKFTYWSYNTKVAEDEFAKGDLTYKAFLHRPNELITINGINYQFTESYGRKEIVQEVSYLPLTEKWFKKDTINNMFYDPERDKYVALYRFTGLDDDVNMSFIHPKYDFHAQIGLYDNMIDLSDIKRDAGRTIYGSIGDLLKSNTTDLLNFTTSGSRGYLTMDDVYKLALLLSNNPDKPLYAFRLAVDKDDEKYICDPKGRQLQGYFNVEIKPNIPDGDYTDDKFTDDYYIKVIFDSNLPGETYIWRKTKSQKDYEIELYKNNDVSGFYRQLVGMPISADNTTSKGYVKGDGYIRIHDRVLSYGVGQLCAEVPVPQGKAVFVYAIYIHATEDEQAHIEIVKHICDFTSAKEMYEFGIRIRDNITDTILICAFSRNAPKLGTNVNAGIEINDYRSDLFYDSRYKTNYFNFGEAFTQRDIYFFGEAYNFNYHGTVVNSGYSYSENNSIRIRGSLNDSPFGDTNPDIQKFVFNYNYNHSYVDGSGLHTKFNTPAVTTNPIGGIFTIADNDIIRPQGIYDISVNWVTEYGSLFAAHVSGSNIWQNNISTHSHIAEKDFDDRPDEITEGVYLNCFSVIGEAHGDVQGFDQSDFSIGLYTGYRCPLSIVFINRYI